MNLERQLLFFFSAIGAFNGLFLSSYFAFFAKHKNRAHYFLSALLLVVSVRVTKSVFLVFYADTSSLFVQIGLSACALIGPFLYLYVKAAINNRREHSRKWLMHVVPVIMVMIYIGYSYPYYHHRALWHRTLVGYFGWILYTQWLIYIIASLVVIRRPIQKLFSHQEKLDDREIWLTSVVIGVAVIWLAYNTVYYTSYIVGAISFSFVFYLMLLFWVFKRRNGSVFFEKPVKYANKKISLEEAGTVAHQLDKLFYDKELHRDPTLKLSDVAHHLNMAPHYVSQYLNDNLGKSFSTFVNEHRVNAAEEMLSTHHQLTLEAIGNECGFKSKSSFYAAFKKFKGVTPARCKKMLN